MREVREERTKDRSVRGRARALAHCPPFAAGGPPVALPAAQPAGLISKMIIDATTPVHPDARGNFSTPTKDLPEAGEWAAKLQRLLSEARG
ncbi:hypothetical protein [Streptomyces sp. SudanB91_2054]|uniref:hypothetical protein n=1 Tax=Streptomyces sp. SudanB91_2054 TaxID=3035278 RepID=UPI0036DA005B